MAYKTPPKQFIDESKELYFPFNGSHNSAPSKQQFPPQQKNSNVLLGGCGQSTKPSSPNYSESEEPQIFGGELKQQKKYSSDMSSTEEFHLESVKPKRRQFGSHEEKKRFVDDYTRKLKTEMCKNWTTTGKCKFGDKCSFAHGSEQLQGKVHLHPNYKTKPCKKFFVQGVCSYGNRCQYIHTITQLLEKGHSNFLKEIYPEKQYFDVPARINYLKQQLHMSDRLHCMANISRKYYFSLRSQNYSPVSHDCALKQNQEIADFKDNINTNQEDQQQLRIDQNHKL